MASYSFSYDFFIPKPEDGNGSMSSMDARITQALALLQSAEDYIVFDDGVRCHNEQELKAAILAYINTLASRKQVESNATKAQTPRWVRVAVIIGLILLFILVDSLNFHILF